MRWPCQCRSVDQLVNDGGGATVLMHTGMELEVLYAKDETWLDPENTTNLEFKCIPQFIKVSIPIDATKWTRKAKYCKGVTEETATGDLRLKEMAAEGEFVLLLSDTTWEMRENACYGVVGQSRAGKSTLMEDTNAEFDMNHPPDVIEKYAPDAIIGTLGEGGEDDDEKGDSLEGGYTMEEVAKHNK